MDPSPDTLKSAIALARAGKKAEARRLLAQAVQANPKNTAAWLWLADTVDNDIERARVLETCLKYNPSCDPAQKGLTILRQRAPGPMAPPDLESPPGPRVSSQSLEPLAGTAPASRPPTAAIPLIPRKTAKRRRTTSFWFAVWILGILAIVAIGLLLIPTTPGGTDTKENLQPKADPIQETIPTQQAMPFPRYDWGYVWTLTPRARFQITARVLGKTRYYFDIRSRLAPYDIALGWGDLSDPTADGWIEWSQHSRWYYYRWGEGAPYDGEYIKTHSANVHIISATKNINAALGLVKRNDIILMAGLLVDSKTSFLGSDYFAGTSLSRTDSGEGACEVLYVERLVIGGKEYK